MSAVFAPPGWGYPTNFAIAGLSADDLPEMPMLPVLQPHQRNAAVQQMLIDRHPLARFVRPRDLTVKYGIPQATTSAILAAARKG